MPGLDSDFTVQTKVDYCSDINLKNEIMQNMSYICEIQKIKLFFQYLNPQTTEETML